MRRETGPLLSIVWEWKLETHGQSNIAQKKNSV